MSSVVPFLKWAGGKRWLVKKYPHLFPKRFKRYFEPFLGSGAVFFSLLPKKGVLADCNGTLVETYNTIKNDWALVEAKLKEHHENHSEEYYYRTRQSSPIKPHTRAARFIYLNRTCFNGLYRVNKQGQFNVPKGTKQNAILDTDDFEAVSNALSGLEIQQSDFENVLNSAQRGDFVFADPPYTVKHNNNNFVKYNEVLFHWDDQLRLRDAVKRASSKGVKVMVTNANHKSVRGLYEADFHIEILGRKSIIASAAKNRGAYEEIVVRNWK